MARKPEDLWQLHSHVASYVMPSKKLCHTLTQKPFDKAAVLKIIGDIQPDAKIRKSKSYYFFGEAYAKEQKSEIRLNPLIDNLHYQFVRHADAFHERLRELNLNDASNIEVKKAAAIANEFKDGFLKCTLQRLKAEVEAACILQRSGDYGPTKEPRTVLKRQKDAEPIPDTRSKARLKVREAAEELRVDTKKIYSLIRSRKLQAIDNSNGQGKRPRYVIDRAAMERFERERTTGPTASEPTAKRRRPKKEGVTRYFNVGK